MKAAYKFHFSSRNGNLYGLFLSTKEDIENMVGEELYFGEVLGKHSEVYGPFEEGDYALLTDDPIFVNHIEVNKLTFGYNPFHYRREEEEEEEYEGQGIDEGDEEPEEN